MLGGDPNELPEAITEEDVRRLYGQVIGLKALVKALFEAFPDPDAARAIVAAKMEESLGGSLSWEHFRPTEHDAIKDTFESVLDPKFYV